MTKMLEMKQNHWTIAVVFLLSMAFAACEAEKTSFGELEKIVVPTKEFAISANVDTTVFGPQGTRIFIEKETFQFADGTPVTDSIQISLQEFYKKSDILLADLSTESNGKLLETGGMINITATSEGQAIEIKEDKRIVVHFPKSSKNRFENEPMNLFYSDNTAAADSGVTNWQVDTVNLVKKSLKIGSWGWYFPSHDDSTRYDFIPKDLVADDYYLNPLDLYLNAYNFSSDTRKEIESNLNIASSSTLPRFNGYGIECEMGITKEGFVKNPRINSKVSPSTRREIIAFLQNIPQLEPGKNKHGEIIERRGLLFIAGGEIIPLYKSREEYLKSFDKKYAKFENNPIKTIDNAELEYYIFSVANLGWINCDRFIEPNDPVDFIVKAPIDKDTKVKLVFSDLNGVLQANVVDGNYVFPNIPKGTAATVFALRNDEGNLLASFQKVTIDDTPFQGLALEAMNLTELKQQLKNLN